MKRYIYIIFFASIGVNAQVGINTNTPRGTLDVNGNILVENEMVINNIQITNDTSSFLLARSEDSTPKGELKLFDINVRDVGPVNKFKVTVTNVDRDKISNLSTNLDTSKYVVAITDIKFLYYPASTLSNNVRSYGTYSAEMTTIASAGKNYYAVNLGFQGINPTTIYTGTTGSTITTQGQWQFSLVVYERALVKDWGTFSGSVGSDSNGVTSNGTGGTPQALR